MALHTVCELPKNSTGVMPATRKHGMRIGAARRSSMVSRNATSIVTKQQAEGDDRVDADAPSQ